MGCVCVLVMGKEGKQKTLTELLSVTAENYREFDNRMLLLLLLFRIGRLDWWVGEIFISNAGPNYMRVRWDAEKKIK